MKWEGEEHCDPAQLPQPLPAPRLLTAGASAALGHTVSTAQGARGARGACPITVLPPCPAAAAGSCRSQSLRSRLTGAEVAAPAPAPARAGGPCPLTQHQQHQQHQHPERPEGDLAQLGGSQELVGVCLESCSAVPRLALEGPQGRAPLPTASPNALLSRCHCGALSYSGPPAARPAPAEVTGADQSAPGAPQHPCRARAGWWQCHWHPLPSHVSLCCLQPRSKRSFVEVESQRGSR